MHRWGDIIPQRGQAEFSVRIVPDALGLLGSVADHMFIMVSCPYMGLDWQGYLNILFTANEPPDDRGNISVFFFFFFN
jgi:hypothetical protein